MDAQALEDSGEDSGTDASSTADCVSPLPEGVEGGACRAAADHCPPGLTCFSSLNATVGVLTGLHSGTPDPEHPGEFLAGPLSAIPVVFSGDTCSHDCGEGIGTCGSCTACSHRAGPTSVWGEILGIWNTVSGIDLGAGICRQRCTFDMGSRGNCGPGTTCDPTSNTCIDSCVSDDQCQLALGLNRRYGIVVYETGATHCDASTGRCTWDTPPESGFLTECARDEDCLGDIGHCGQFCTWYQCDLAGPDGELLYPCPTGSTCLSEGEDTPGSCVPSCLSSNDCPSRTACSDGACISTCTADFQCRDSERCRPLDLLQGTCSPVCDAEGTGVAGAIACGTRQVCIAVPSRDFGFCYDLGALCVDDADCVAGERCTSNMGDVLGRCS